MRSPAADTLKALVSSAGTAAGQSRAIALRGTVGLLPPQSPPISGSNGLFAAVYGGGNSAGAPLFLEINAALEINTLLGIVLVADHLRVDTSQFKVGGGIFAATGNNDFSGAGLAQERLYNRLDRQ